jgi:hypothetical protein
MRGHASEEEPTVLIDVVRGCSECHRAKSIRGVWYLVPGHAASPFVCETCFSVPRTTSAVI